jgi:hypothetical protein
MNGLIQVELRPDHAMYIHRYQRRVKGQRPSQRERLAAFRLAAFAACLPRAVRVFFGRRVMVRFRFAALAALPIFLLAAAFCLAVAIIAS